MADSRSIPFSPPDITEEDIQAVADALRSGWITTGPRTKELEKKLAEFTEAGGVATFGSGTAALECGLRLLGVGPGDEVITSAYTYTASASCIIHVGARPVLVDTAPGSYEMDPGALKAAMTERTRAVIPVDLGGRMVDYDALFVALGEGAAEGRWHPRNPADTPASSRHGALPAEELSAAEKRLGRPFVLGDGAHSLGAVYKGHPSGSVADLTAFSFHAVKNFTTAEGGALAWRAGLFDDEEVYRLLMLQSLHGQSKDALAKTKAGAWEYDIAFPGWKCNMTDMQGALGLSQLKRYPAMMARRRQLIEGYERGLADLPITLMAHKGDGWHSSGHLMLTRLDGRSRAYRNRFIELMAEAGVACNVHFKPLPLLTAYRDLGFNEKDFPNAVAQFDNSVTLPLYSTLCDDDLDYIIGAVHGAMAACDGEFGAGCGASGEL